MAHDYKISIGSGISQLEFSAPTMKECLELHERYQQRLQPVAVDPTPRVWTCKIGGNVHVPSGGDAQMRGAVELAFMRMVGKKPDFCFTGWGGDLSPLEKEIAYKNGQVSRD